MLLNSYAWRLGLILKGISVCLSPETSFIILIGLGRIHHGRYEDILVLSAFQIRDAMPGAAMALLSRGRPLVTSDAIRPCPRLHMQNGQIEVILLAFINEIRNSMLTGERIYS